MTEFNEEEISVNPYADKFFPNSRQVWRIASNLKKLIDQIIPIEFKEEDITQPNSPVLNEQVIALVYEAAGGKGDGKLGSSSHRYQASIVFCLLKVCGWYWQQSEFELYDTGLFNLRAIAAQNLAAIIIDRTENDEYLFLAMLCHRYSICLNDEDSVPLNVMELAVDMHCTTVIGSSGYQRCIKWLWRGWIVQSEKDPYSYELYKGASSHKLSTHFNPSRVKTPLYQNILEIFLSLLYLALFSIVLNTHNLPSEGLDVFEVMFYFFTFGLICDELIKFYHIGFNYFGFWNAFNDVMYAIVAVAVGFRISSLVHSNPSKEIYDEMSFRILSLASPMMWSRLLLYLDAQKFVGAMIVVIKTMMQESILFFVMLFFILVGFLQGFLGLDAADGKSEETKAIFLFLVKSVIGSSGFGDVKMLVQPYASILYFVFTFVLSVILMNILVALYSTAYANIVDNATDEYFALVAQKTLRYIRAPDTDLFIPPFNLIEFILTPFFQFVPYKYVKTINYFVLLTLYSPLLLYISIDELANARRIHYNRYKGLADDANEIDTEWDLTDGYVDSTGDSWDAIQESNSQVSQALQDQRNAENEDPEFKINLVEFNEKIKSIVQPVTEAHRVGVKWELMEIYTKINKLTELVESVVEENKKLKIEQVPEIKTEIKTEPKTEPPTLKSNESIKSKDSKKSKKK